MKNWFHRHKFYVVAYDHGYYTTYTDSGTKTFYHSLFSKCDCGCRTFQVKKSSKYSPSSAYTQAESRGGLMRAKHAWIEKNELRLTASSDVYNDDYVKISSSVALDVYKYQPVTEVGKILNLLKASDEFTELRKHTMIDDAFGELETVIKMHEGIDTTI